MIRVLLEASNGISRLMIAVRAESVRRAVEMAREQYSDGDVDLVLPIDPDTFFVKGPASEVELVEIVTPEGRGDMRARLRAGTR